MSSTVTGVVNGSVKNASNEAIAEARVMVLTNTEPTRLVNCVLTRANGQYSFEWLDESQDLIFIVDPPLGSASTLGSTGTVRRMPITSPLNWQLGTAELSGVVRLDGSTAPDLATVCLRPTNLRNSQVGVDRCGSLTPRLGGDRLFAIDTDGLNLSNYQLQVSVRNNTSQIYDFVAIPSTGRLNLILNLSSTTTPLQLAPCLVSSGSAGNLNGVVTSANGNVLAGARVEVYDPALYPSAVYGCVLTDSQGRYSIDTRTYEPFQLLRSEWTGFGEVGFESPPAECSDSITGWCMNEDRDYLVMVDPPVGSLATVGSTGGVVTAGTGSPINWQLGTADVAGTLKLSGRNSQDSLIACVRDSSRRESVLIMARCGRVIERNDGSRSFAIDTNGMAGTSKELLVEYRSRFNLLTDYVSFASNPLSVAYDFNPIKPNNGCSSRQKPNVVGQVTRNGTGVATKIFDVSRWRMSNTSPYQFERGQTFSTANDGTFSFCVYVPSISGIEGHFAVTAISPRADTGSKMSAFTDDPTLCTGTTPCVFNIALEAAKLSTRLTNAAGTQRSPGTMTYLEKSNNGFWDATALVSSNDEGLVTLGSLGEGNFRLRVSPGYCYEEVDCLSRSEGYGETIAGFTVDGSGNFSLGSSFTGTPTNSSLIVKTANIAVVVRRPDGTLAEAYTSHGGLQKDTTSCNAQPYQFECQTQVTTASGGRLFASVADGNWKMTIQDGESSSSGSATLKISVVNGSVAAVEAVTGTASLDNQVISVGLPEMQLIFGIQDANGAAKERFNVQVYELRFGTNMGPSLYPYYLPTKQIENSRLGVDIATSSFIWLKMMPAYYWDESGSHITNDVPTSKIFKLDFSNGILTSISECPGFTWSNTTCAGGQPLAKVGGSYPVRYAEPKIVAKICDWTATTETCATHSNNVSAEIEMEVPNSPGSRTSIFNYQLQGETFKFNPKNDGKYFVTLNPGQSMDGNSGVDTSALKPIRFQIIVSENATRFWKCTDATASCSLTSSSLTELIPVNGLVNLGDQRFVESSQKGFVKTPTGVAVAQSQIQIHPESGTNWPLRSWAYSDAQGRFVLDLLPGTYMVSASPAWNSAGGLVAGKVRLKILGTPDGGTSMQIFENNVWVDKTTFEVRLRLPNVSGTLLPPLGDTSRSFIANAHFNFERRVGQTEQYEWVNIWGNTNSTGQFSFGLDDGTWRINISPPYELGGDYSSTRKLVKIVDGVVTEIDGIACGLCVPDFRLTAPSLRGFVKDSTGALVLNASLSARRLGGYLVSDYWNSWTNSGNAGKFAFAIPPSPTGELVKYEVRIEPPYMSSTASNLATTVKYFGVLARNGTDYICALSSELATSCSGEELVFGSLVDLTMNSANVLGQILFNDGGVQGWIEVFKKLSDGEFRYESGISSRQDGTFAIRLEEGMYKLTARPNSVANGEAPGTLYALVRSDLTYCVGAIPPNNTCTTSPRAEIELESANLRGTLKTETGEAISNIWVEANSWNSQGGYWEWLPGVNVGSNGQFALQLKNDGSEAKKFQVSIRIPEWNTSGAASKKFTIWVDDFILGGSQNDLCVAVSLASCQGQNIWAAGNNRDFIMGRGNLVGDLRDSSGNLVSGQYLQMEMSTGTDTWTWYNSSVNTNMSGRFALDLDPGKYRFRVEPSAELRSTHSEIRQTIVVSEDGTWCREESSGCVDDNELNLQYRLSNVRAQIDMTGARWAWANVRRWKSESIDCSTPLQSDNWNCWEWLNIFASPNNEGKFSLQLPIGKYGLNVEIDLSDGTRRRLNVFFEVNSDSFIGEPVPGVTGIRSLSPTQSVVGGVLQIAPPPPTVQGVLREPSVNGALGNTVRWSWIEVQQMVTDSYENTYWQWKDLGTSTGDSGRFALGLEIPGSGELNRYRLRFRSNVGSLATFSADLLINEQNEHAIDLDQDGIFDAGSEEWLAASNSWLVSFPSPNLTGILTASDGMTTVTEAWLNAQQWVSYGNTDNTGYWNWTDIWSSADQSGRYSMVLPEGDYRIEVRPSGNSVDLAGFYAFVTVDSNGDVHRCPSAADQPCTGGSPGTDINLSFPAPTIRGELVREDGSTPVTDAWMPVQKWNGSYWEWSSTAASSNRSGRFALLLDSGIYRMEINPPWYLRNLGRFAVYFNIADDPNNAGEKLWCDATADRNCVPSRASSELMQIQMRVPNVAGTVMDHGAPSQQSWVGISGSDGYWNGTQTDSTGTFRFILEDGQYTMYSFPNWSTSTSPYAVTRIVVFGGEVIEWLYLSPSEGTDQCASAEPGTCVVEIVLDRTPPNISGTVNRNGSAATGAFITARNGSNEVVARTVTDANGRYEMFLPAGSTYSVKVTIVDGLAVVSQEGSVSPPDSTLLDFVLFDN